MYKSLYDFQLDLFRFSLLPHTAQDVCTAGLIHTSCRMNLFKEGHENK